MKPITIGTRGSALATAQAQEVIRALRILYPRREFEITVIRTGGDTSPGAALHALDGTGMFVKEIEQALLNGICDIAVHSLKDMPVPERAGLVTAAIPERADPFDLLITRNSEQLPDLRAGARVGTSSRRRAAQLLAVRADLTVMPIRGNVDTRLKKLVSGEYDALVLAAAGIDRLGMRRSSMQLLLPPTFLPAPGQGCMAIQIRKDDREMYALVHALDHPPSRACATAERAFLRESGAGCHSPVGAYAERLNGDRFLLTASILSPDGKEMIRGKREGSMDEPAKPGIELARHLLEEGGERAANLMLQLPVRQ